ncbi:MAG: DNA-binding protein [Thermoleophilia bacterium]|nr:DNA-binding protein [Thermoleophilia bacterium]
MDHVGEKVTIEGPVASTKWASSSKGAPTFLNIGRPYPDPDRLTVLIWEEYRSRFPAPPEEMYAGHVIRVTGVVSVYKGVAEIEVKRPDQMEIIK